MSYERVRYGEHKMFIPEGWYTKDELVEVLDLMVEHIKAFNKAADESYNKIKKKST